MRNWSTLRKALDELNDAVKNIKDFNEFHLHKPLTLLAKNGTTAVHTYTSKLLVYHNEHDPHDYPTYEALTSVRIASQGTLHEVVVRNYRTMYLHMLDKLRSSTASHNAEGRYYFELVGRAAIAYGGDFLVNDLTAAMALPARDRGNQVRRLRLTRGAVMPPDADLDARWSSLPNGANGVMNFEPHITTAATALSLLKSEASVALNDLAQTVGAFPAVPVPRRVYHSSLSTYPNVDCVDQLNRGYQFTTSNTHFIRYASMHDRLTAIGSSPTNRFYLFLCVPEHVFPKWKSIQTLTHPTDATPDEENAQTVEIHTQVYQYVIRIPADLPLYV